MNASEDRLKWEKPTELPPVSYCCGHCGDQCSSNSGYKGEYRFPKRHPEGIRPAYIYLCGGCGKPTYTVQDFSAWTIPRPKGGRSVAKLPQNIHSLYEEARVAHAAGAPTAATLLCRKLLMNTAVEEGADEGKSFAHYIQFLKTNGLLPPKSDRWVDKIRTNGNEATHLADPVDPELAKRTLELTTALLAYVYELADEPEPTE